MRAILILAVLAFVLVVGVQPAPTAAQGSVLVVRIRSEIARPTAELVARSIEEAKVGALD